MKKRQIGLIGAGNVGSALAKRLVELGHTVKVANSKGPQTLEEFEKQTGVKALMVSEIAGGIDLLFIAIPLGNVGDLRESLKNLPQGAVTVDTGNYIPQRDGAIPAIEQGLAESAWVSQQLGVPVVKAFNNIIALNLANNGQPLGSPNRIALPVASDSDDARTTVMELVEELGFSAYDAGPLADSWRQQPGQPAYCTDPTRNELPSLLARADQAKAPGNRDQAMKLMAKIPPTFPAQDLVRVSRISVGLDTLKPISWLAMLRLGVALLRS